MRYQRAVAAAALLATSAHAAATFNVSNVFGSYAVLQRGKPAVVWGWADSSSATISATWVDGKQYTGTSDASLLWKIVFPAAAESTVAFNLTFTSLGSDAVTLSEILIGDVFLCSGQSNMGAVTVGVMANASAIAGAAAALAYLRIFAVSGNLNSSVPLPEWPTSGLSRWQPPLAPGPNGNSTLLGFSAACYLMGSTLYQEYLNGAVPIGLIHSSHGGTSIQAWQSPASVDTCGTPSNSWPSSVLYNSNIHPITLGPLAIAGTYWYQGEQDCGIGSSNTYYRAGWYGCALQALIADWRALLADESIHWVVQQLHAWLHTADAGLALFRQAQLKALSLPGVSYSTAFDGGDPASAQAGSPGGTVHSHFKYIPARRAAASFAGAYYGLPVPYLHPTYGDATARSTFNATHSVVEVTVALQSGTVSAAGLVVRGWEADSNSSHCPTERAVNETYCDWFAIQVDDDALSWHNASVVLTPARDGVVLTAVLPTPGLSAVSTRFGWGDWPVVTVYSAEGFPLLTWNKPVTG